MGALCQEDGTEYVQDRLDICYERSLLFLSGQTAITARVHDEFNCLPVENEEYQRLAEERALESLKPKRETKFIEKVPGKMLQPKTVAAADKSNFIVSPVTSFPVVGFCLTLYSKLRNRQKCALRKTKLPVCPRTSFWTLSTLVSGDTSIGPSRRLRPSYSNQKCISNKPWRLWHIWLKAATSP